MNGFHALPIEAWPRSHREAFENAVDETLPGLIALARNWSDDTKRSVKLAWGLWLDFRIRHGFKIDCPPADTIVRSEFELFIRELTGRVRYSTSSTYVRDAGEGLRVMQPGNSGPAVKLVRAAARDLRRAAEPLPDNLTPRVGSSDLYEAAIARMDELWDDAMMEWRDALAYLDALMIVIAVLTALRLRTLALTAKNHVKLKGDFYRLRYRPYEVKTRKMLLRSLHPDVTRYVEHGFKISARLAGEEESGEATLQNLWVTRFGNAMSRSWVSKRIRRASMDLVGVPLNPQRIRRLSATSIYRFVPRKTNAATSNLQHHNAQRTHDNYIKVGGGGAAVEFHRLMQAKFPPTSSDDST